MAEDTNPQAGASDIAKRLKRGKKVIIIQQTPVSTAANDDNDANEEYDSDLDNNDRRYNFHTLVKLLELLPKLTLQNYYSWREYNFNYLPLDIIREYLTFNQVWKKIENSLGSKATRNSCQLALITQLGDIKMFHV
ncbi:hypothetical protein NDA12_002239 [Ustilago hordei]|nr:hypothetical protein NDA12_002239 [Ustilago hordei]